jgi:hypothetical protein
MSMESERALAPELGRDERVIWSGMPLQGVRLAPADALLIPFSLLWGGFAIFWETSVIRAGAPIFFELWGVPFVLAGLYIIAGRFFVDSYLRKLTFYGLTAQRVITISGLGTRTVRSLALTGLSEMTLTERADQSGTIIFGPTSPMYSMWSGTGWPGMGRKLAPAFERIEGVRQVYDLIRAARESARKS